MSKREQGECILQVVGGEAQDWCVNHVLNHKTLSPLWLVPILCSVDCVCCSSESGARHAYDKFGMRQAEAFINSMHLNYDSYSRLFVVISLHNESWTCKYFFLFRFELWDKLKFHVSFFRFLLSCVEPQLCHVVCSSHQRVQVTIVQSTSRMPEYRMKCIYVKTAEFILLGRRWWKLI